MADPFGMTGIPGANPGGTQQQAPGSPFSIGGQSVGGTNNPLLPSFPAGTSMPGNSNPIAALNNNPANSFWGFGQGTANPLHDITKALGKAGFSAGVAGELANFLQSGAGFNPAVAQALIAAMQPGVERKEADIMEQFSGMGLRGGSPAALGLSDFLAQEQLNEGQIWAGLYEQSVQNYLNVLLAGKQPTKPKGSFFDNLMTYIQTSSQAAMAAAAGGA